MSTISKEGSAEQSRLRILVVENDPETRAGHVDNLRYWGYESFVAEAAQDAQDKHHALLEDAVAKAHSHRCHLALVDMRLRHDDDSSETSGLALVPLLAPTVSIIVSGYGDRKTVRDALKSPPEVPERAYDFIGKQDGPEALQRVIQDAEKTIWHRRAVEFVRPYGLGPAALATQFSAGDEAIPSDEIDDVLRRLFPQAKRLKIERLGESVPIRGMAPRQRSVILKVTVDDHARPVVVKLGRDSWLAKEGEHFNMVRSYFTPPRYTLFHKDVVLWDIGGAAYEILGEDASTAQPFSAYYVTQQVRDIQEALGQFTKLWKSLYARKARGKVPLLDTYTNMWGEKWYEALFQHNEKAPCPEYFSGLGLPDPIAWFRERIVSSPDGQASIPLTDVTLIHGDLHGDNLLVDERQGVWVIDYERTGPGPLLHDFTELEMDILTRLARLEDEPACFYDLMLAVLKPFDSQQKLESTQRILGSSKARKALSVIVSLREQASAIGEKDDKYDQRLYFWSLLLNALYRLYLWRPEVSTAAPAVARYRQQQIYSLAGMICHRLDNWLRPWPPREWPLCSWVSYTEHQDCVDAVELLYEQLADLRPRSQDDAQFLEREERLRQQLIELGEFSDR